VICGANLFGQSNVLEKGLEPVVAAEAAASALKFS
jgi:hypothetical protein